MPEPREILSKAVPRDTPFLRKKRDVFLRVYAVHHRIEDGNKIFDTIEK